MSTYCLKCRTKTENVNETTERTKNNRMILKSICAICGKRKNMFLKKTVSPAIGAGCREVILIDD